MAAEAAGLLSKEIGEMWNLSESLDSSGLNDKEFSLESEGGCEEEVGDEMDSELLAYARESSKMATSDRGNDGKCLTQEELVGSSGNQKPLSSLDFTTGDGMPCSNVQNPPLGIGGLEEVGVTNSRACSFCLKALKKSIKFARLLEAKNQGNEYAVNAGRYNSKRAAEMDFELSQQQR